MSSRARRVRLLENIHPAAQEQFINAGFKDIEILSGSSSGDQLSKILASSEVLGIRSKTRISGHQIKKNPQILAIGCFCIGTDQVDLRSAKLEGTPVFNAPYSNTRSVAELVMAEVVCLARKVCDMSQHAHRGIWQKTASGSYEVRGKTLGIIGYGHIGSQLSILAESFGMRVIYYDIHKKLPLGNAASTNSMPELLKLSDFVSLHVPDTVETRNMISEHELSLMKPGAFLLNLSRGKVVDLVALASALKSKKIAGAGIDVYPEEPESNGEGFSTVLQGLPNVILTPHIGGSTEEAQEAIAGEVSHALIEFLLTGSTPTAVNFPRLSLPSLKTNGLRVLNVHQNVPGVLGEINSIVSKRGVNISAQYLSTDSDIGYLAMDVETRDPLDLTKDIHALETSLKTRLVRP